MLSGYKTYIVGVASILYAGFGLTQGWLDSVQAMQIIQVALASMGLRAAIS